MYYSIEDGYLNWLVWFWLAVDFVWIKHSCKQFWPQSLTSLASAVSAFRSSLCPPPPHSICEFHAHPRFISVRVWQSLYCSGDDLGHSDWQGLCRRLTCLTKLNGLQLSPERRVLILVELGRVERRQATRCIDLRWRILQSNSWAELEVRKFIEFNSESAAIC